MPFHCQKKMIADLSHSLADLYGFSQKQESPIALADSPLPSFDFNGSESENVLAYARTSTSKPDKKKKKKTIDDDTMIYGPANGRSFVTVRGGDPSLPDAFQDASQGSTGGRLDTYKDKITKKAIEPSDAEVKANGRARSAKLRIASKNGK